MATAPKFRIDVDIHNLLMDSSREPVRPAVPKGLTLPEPVFPQYPEKLTDPGPEIAPEKRDWRLAHVSIRTALLERVRRFIGVGMCVNFIKPPDVDLEQLSVNVLAVSS